MSKEAKSESGGDWGGIDRLVAEPFDLEDVGNRYGVSRWREEMEKLRGGGDDGGRFSSEEVYNAAVAFFKADIEENIFIYRAKLIRNDRVRKLMELRRAIAEFEGVLIEDENGDRMFPGCIEVVQETRSSKIRKLRQVVRAAEAMANSDARYAAEVPSWPVGLGDGFAIFVKDLADYLERNEGEGAELVSRVCRDAAFAKESCDDVAMPICVRFLAEIVVEVKTVNPSRIGRYRNRFRRPLVAETTT